MDGEAGQFPAPPIRLQFNKDFGFDEAALAPYLSSLGVSHAYCSPLSAAAPAAHAIPNERRPSSLSLPTVRIHVLQVASWYGSKRWFETQNGF
jgi:hypothetical protein